MSELVLDASVVVKWFKVAGEEHVDSALRLYQRFSEGELLVVVPSLLFLELVNAAARGWGWDATRLERFAGDLASLGLDARQPSLAGVARWCARGLTAYDASYVALAEERRTVVVTDDERIIAVAGALARPLSSMTA